MKEEPMIKSINDKFFGKVEKEEVKMEEVMETSDTTVETEPTEETLEKLKSVVSSEPKELTHSALGTYFNEATGRYHIVEIKFNPFLDAVGELELLTDQ